jgi:hypothetical protein
VGAVAATKSARVPGPDGFGRNEAKEVGPPGGKAAETAANWVVAGDLFVTLFAAGMPFIRKVRPLFAGPCPVGGTGAAADGGISAGRPVLSPEAVLIGAPAVTPDVGTVLRSKALNCAAAAIPRSSDKQIQTGCFRCLTVCSIRNH